MTEWKLGALISAEMSVEFERRAKQNAIDHYKARAEKAEARVQELEAMLETTATFLSQCHPLPRGAFTMLGRVDKFLGLTERESPSVSIGETENEKCVQDCDAMGIVCPKREKTSEAPPLDTGVKHTQTRASGVHAGTANAAAPSPGGDPKSPGAIPLASEPCAHRWTKDTFGLELCLGCNVRVHRCHVRGRQPVLRPSDPWAVDHLECAACGVWCPGADKPEAWTEETGRYYCYGCSEKLRRTNEAKTGGLPAARVLLRKAFDEEDAGRMLRLVEHAREEIAPLMYPRTDNPLSAEPDFKVVAEEWLNEADGEFIGHWRPAVAIPELKKEMQRIYRLGRADEASLRADVACSETPERRLIVVWLREWSYDEDWSRGQALAMRTVAQCIEEGRHMPTPTGGTDT